MCSKISWWDFSGFLFIAGGIYYATIAIVYYRQDILKITKHGLPKKRIHPQQSVTPTNSATKINPATNNDGKGGLLFTSVHDLMEELKILFANAADKKFHKEELIVALQITLQKHSLIKGTAFQVAVNNHITQLAKDCCKVELEQTDLKRAWVI